MASSPRKRILGEANGMSVFENTVSPDPTSPARAGSPCHSERFLPRLLKSLARLSERGVLLGWILLAVAIVMGTQSCSLMWALANPAPHHWDNADYLNLEYNDSWAWRYGGPSPSHPSGYRGVWDSLINADHNRPPGYRIPALPLVYLGTPILPTLRELSHLFFWATLAIVYLTCTTAVPGNAGRAAGLAAAILLSLYLTVGWAIRVFGTEYTLYFSVALMLLCLARATRPDLHRHLTWIGLGLAMGLGVLSKLSFITIAAPAGLLAFILIQNRQLPGLSLLGLIGSTVIGAAMAYPWYRFHFFEAKNYGMAMTEFTRHSLHESGFALLKSWLMLHIEEGMGVRAAWMWAGLVVVGLLGLGAALLMPPTPGSEVLRRAGSADARSGSSEYLRDRRRFLNCPAAMTIYFALAQGLPLPIFQLVYSHSDNARHVTPAYIPLTVAAAVLAGAVGVLAAWWSWPLLFAFAIPAVQQVGREFIPLTTTPDDIWDWDPLRQVCIDRHIRFPFIGRVGNSGQFNEAAIIAPWAKAGDWATCEWLWRSEDGKFDWTAIQNKLADRDVVVTAPGFAVPRDGSMLADPLASDNSHNIEMQKHLLADPDWQLAKTFPIGIVNKAEIWVFVRKVRLKH
jgi:hypothetical protein